MLQIAELQQSEVRDGAPERSLFRKMHGLWLVIAALAPARSRDFMLLWLGQGLSQFGTSASWIAWMWLLTDLTNSTTLIGLVLAAYSMPVILFMLPAGISVDRGDPQHIALWSELANVFLGFGLAVLVILDRISVSSFLAFAILFGLTQAFITPALAVLFPAIVAPSEFYAANSLRHAALQAATLLGPPLGGYLVAQWNIGVALVLDAATFALSATAIYFIRRPAATAGIMTATSHHDLDPASGYTFLEDLRSGISFLHSEYGMFVVVLLFSLTNALNNVEAVLVPVLVRTELELSAAQYGLMSAFMGGGGLVAALVIGVIGHRIRYRAAVICGGMAVFGIAIIAMSLAAHSWHLYIAYTAFGLSFTVPEIVSVTVWQQIIPAELRGRLFSLLGTIAMVANPVGFLFAGAIGDAFGVRHGLQIGGAAILCLSLIVLFVPAVRMLDHRVSSLNDNDKRGDTSFFFANQRVNYDNDQ